METFQLVQAMAPTRHEKRRVATARGYRNEDTIYKECEDPDGSGRANPLDKLLCYFDHALVHNVDAALAVVQFLELRAATSLQARAAHIPLADLLLALQPRSEKESIDAVRAFSCALRQLLLGKRCDSEPLLREVEEAERELHKAAVMLRAALQAEGKVS